MIQNEKEYNDLLDVLLPFGQQMLRKHGEFFPYGAVVGADGALELVAGEIGQECPEPSAVLDILFEAMRKLVKEKACRAAGVCVNVQVLDPRSGQKGDALHFIFEHASGEALDIYFPYRKRFLRGYQFEKPFAQNGESRLFTILREWQTPPAPVRPQAAIPGAGDSPARHHCRCPHLPLPCSRVAAPEPGADTWRHRKRQTPPSPGATNPFQSSPAPKGRCNEAR